jgi:hypothetical protein
MANISTNNTKFQEFLTEAKCCNAKLGADYYDAIQMASVDADCILPKWRKLTAFFNSIEDYIPLGTILVPSVSATAIVDFSSFDISLLADDMTIIVSVSGDYNTTLATITGDFFGFSLNDFIDAIITEIELQSVWTATRVASTLVIESPSGIGALPNGSEVQIIFPDYFAQVNDEDLGAVTFAPPKQISVAPVTRTVYTTNDLDEIKGYDTVSDVVTTTAGYQGDTVFLPVQGHRGYSELPNTPLGAFATWGGDVRLSDSLFFYTSITNLYVVDASNTVVDTIPLGGISSFYYTVINQSTDKIYVFNNAQEYREVTWTSFGVYAVGAAIALPALVDFSLGNSCYSPFNQSVYAYVWGYIVQINSAGVAIDSVTVANTSFNHWIGVNPYNGNIYAKQIDAGTSIYTYSPSLSLLSTNTIASTIGQIGIDVGVDDTTLKMYGIGGTYGSNFVYEYDSSFNFINQYNIDIPNILIQSCYFSKQTGFLILIALNQSGTYSIITYSVGEGKVLMRSPQIFTSLLNYTNQFFEDATNNIWFQSNGLSGAIQKLAYRDYSSYTEGQLWVQAFGTTIKIFYINGTSLVESDFYINNNDFGFQRITAHSNNSVALYKEGTVVFPYFIYVDATNLSGFVSMGGTVGLYDTEAVAGAVGMYQIDSVIYNDITQTQWMIGLSYPVASGNEEIHTFSNGVWQGSINNNFIKIKAIAHNTTNGLVYSIDANGVLKAYDSTLSLVSTTQLSFTPSVNEGIMIYDSFYDKLVYLNGVGGELYIINPNNGVVVEPISLAELNALFYAIHSIASDMQGRIYLGIIDLDNTVARVLSISLVDGDEVNLDGSISGGITGEVQTENCLTAAQVQVVIDKIKQLCQICEGCGEYAKTALPDPIPENFDTYIVTDSNSYIIDDLGNRIIT